MRGGKTASHLKEDSCELSRLGLAVARLPFLLYLILALAAVLFVADGRDFPHKRGTLLPNWVLLATGLALVLVLMFVVVRRVSAKGIHLEMSKADRVVALVTLVLAVVQLVLVRSYVFPTDWDSGGVKWSAWGLAHREGFDVRYYSTYPNNLLLLRLAQLCMRIAVHFGAEQPIEGVWLFCILNVISCAVALWCVYWTLSRVVSVGCGLTGWTLSILLLWTSPWVAVMYSDAFLLGLTPLAIALLVLARRSQGVRRYVCLGCFGLLTWWGYCIKPQSIFMLFAFFAMGALAILGALRRGGAARSACLRKTALDGLCVVVGVTLALLSAKVATRGLRVCLNDEAQFSAAHFLMMGLNSEKRGVYCQDDVNFSRYFETRAERNAADMRRAAKRVQEMGPAGLADLFLDKTLINYDDGTFAWVKEGTKFFGGGPAFPGPLTALAQSIYYNTGAFFKVFLTYEQLVWLVVLVFCLPALMSGLFKRRAVREETSESTGVARQNDADYLVSYIALVLIMLSCFQLLFEARARYLYAFSPYYVVLAAMGMHLLAKRIFPNRKPPLAQN